MENGNFATSCIVCIVYVVHLHINIKVVREKIIQEVEERVDIDNKYYYNIIRIAMNVLFLLGVSTLD